MGIFIEGWAKKPVPQRSCCAVRLPQHRTAMAAFLLTHCKLFYDHFHPMSWILWLGSLSVAGCQPAQGSGSSSWQTTRAPGEAAAPLLPQLWSQKSGAHQAAVPGMRATEHSCSLARCWRAQGSNCFVFEVQKHVKQSRWVGRSSLDKHLLTWLTPLKQTWPLACKHLDSPFLRLCSEVGHLWNRNNTAGQV